MNNSLLPTPRFSIVALTLGLSLLACGPRDVFAQVEFSPFDLYPIAGSSPFCVVAEDLDSDGHLDILSTHFLDGCLTLHRGTGLGVFQPAELLHQFSESDVNPDSIVTGDYNEDGKIDFALTRRSAADIIVFVGDGTGAFIPGSPVPVGIEPNRLATGDLDNDGHLDLVTALGGGASIDVLFGDGLLNFPVTLNLPTSSTPFDVIVFSANNDSFLDLAVVTFAGDELILFLGQENRTFSSPDIYPIGDNGASVRSGDWNGDFISDLAISLYYNPIILVALGNGDGTFSTPTPTSASTNTYNLNVADFNLDGKPDLISPSQSFNGVNILLGLGDGTFLALDPIEMESDGFDLAVGDFDEDCLTDFAVAGYRKSNISVRTNRTPGLNREPRTGNVNSGVGAVTNVLQLNGQTGSGTERIVEYNALGSFRLSVGRPPAVEPPARAPFVIYLWTREPTSLDTRGLPFGLGCLAMPAPIAGGGEPQPRVIWNNAMRGRILGFPTRSSAAAPTDLIDLPALRTFGRFYAQGLIYDPGSGASVPASVTNGIVGRPVIMR